jgi:hypothetical protein
MVTPSVTNVMSLDTSTSRYFSFPILAAMQTNEVITEIDCGSSTVTEF